jgi:predicted HicB family RNase H-like nuclease
MEYKGYIGYVEFDDESEIFHGEVINTRDVITFQGKSVSEIKQEFQKSVDVYLDFCKRHGKEPDKPFSGKLTLRLAPDLHRRAFAAAKRSGKSLNQWVAEQIELTV